MTFRARTALTVAILTALALGGAFTGVSEAFNGLQRQQLDASLRSVALQEAQEAPAHHFSFSDRPGPAANDVGPLTKYGIIFDEAGRVVSSTPPFDVSPPTLKSLKSTLGQAFDLWFGGNHFRGVLVAIPQHPGKLLFLATSRDDLDGDEAFLFRAMLAAFVVAVLWAAAVSYWMGGRLTLAHRDIASVVRQVTAGDLSARVHVKASDPEVDRLGREINEMVARLDELLKSQQRFVAHAAHELRTPLAALYGELQHARRKPRDITYYEKTIDAALDAARHLNLLAEDLLTLAKARGSVNEQCQPIVVGQAIEQARALVDSLARERDVHIGIGGDMSQPIMDRKGDTIRLLRNLLENAVRHSPVKGLISVSVVREQGNVIIRVSDNGPGVATAEREVIFEPFFRAPGAALTGGAGLGLGIAREIARSYGGDVRLDPRSVTHSGACFVVSLPEGRT